MKTANIYIISILKTWQMFVLLIVNADYSLNKVFKHYTQLFQSYDNH